MPDQPTPLRPTGITIIAWLWIVLGTMMIFSAVMGAIAFSFIGPPPSAAPDTPDGFKFATTIFNYFGYFLVTQAIVATLAIWAGIALLKLKAWARTTIECVSWLAFLYIVGFGIFWIYMWVSMTGSVPNDNSPINMDVFQIAGAVMGFFVTIVFAVPPWIMIRYLRGTEARVATAR